MLVYVTHDAIGDAVCQLAHGTSHYYLGISRTYAPSLQAEVFDIFCIHDWNRQPWTNRFRATVLSSAVMGTVLNGSVTTTGMSVPTAQKILKSSRASS